jgi:hypothetical protein
MGRKRKTAIADHRNQIRHNMGLTDVTSGHGDILAVLPTATAITVRSYAHRRNLSLSDALAEACQNWIRKEQDAM